MSPFPFQNVSNPKSTSNRSVGTKTRSTAMRIQTWPYFGFCFQRLWRWWFSFLWFNSLHDVCLTFSLLEETTKFGNCCSEVFCFFICRRWDFRPLEFILTTLELGTNGIIQRFCSIGEWWRDWLFLLPRLSSQDLWRVEGERDWGVRDCFKIWLPVHSFPFSPSDLSALIGILSSGSCWVPVWSKETPCGSSGSAVADKRPERAVWIEVKTGLDPCPSLASLLLESNLRNCGMVLVVGASSKVSFAKGFRFQPSNLLGSDGEGGGVETLDSFALYSVSLPLT